MCSSLTVFAVYKGNIMNKSIYIDSFCGDSYAALAKGSTLIEYHIDSANAPKEIVGNIYKGKVTNVLNGMQAAFVNIGMERNGYLSLDDVVADKSTLSDSVSVPQKLKLRVGDEIMVQVTKVPVGKKGAKLTAHLSFVGKYLIYLPTTNFLGISRKIDDEERRDELMQEVDKLRNVGSGFIIRTAARTAKKRQLKVEAEYLKGLYKEALENYDKAKTGEIVHSEDDLPLRVIRDNYDETVDKIIVGNKDLYDRLENLLTLRGENAAKRLVMYSGNRDMFTLFGLAKEVKKLTDSKVVLESGAYLIIDKTEALTVIDVNTGKYVGNDNLETTVFNTNMLAAKEIARQVRLRNIGGIVIVDFIDMEDLEHRAKVVKTLEENLKDDRVKCNVIGMTGFGLVQFTRKKDKRDTMSALTQPCPYCEGSGLIQSDDYIFYKLFSAIKDCLADGYNKVIVELNDHIMEVLIKKDFPEDMIKFMRNKRIYMIPQVTYHEEEFNVRGIDGNNVLAPPNAILLNKGSFEELENFEEDNDFEFDMRFRRRQ